MLTLSNRAVGMAFFGVIAALISGLCFGLRAWWPAGIGLVLAIGGLLGVGRVAIEIDEVLLLHQIPLSGGEHVSLKRPPLPRPESRSRSTSGSRRTKH